MNNNLKKYFCLTYFFILIFLGIFLENSFLFSISLLSFFIELMIFFRFFGRNFILYRNPIYFILLAIIAFSDLFFINPDKFFISILNLAIFVGLFYYFKEIRSIKLIDYFFDKKFINIFLHNSNIFSINYSNKDIKHYYRIYQTENSISYEPRLIKIKDQEIKIKDALNYCKMKDIKLENITVEDLNLINILSY